MTTMLPIDAHRELAEIAWDDHDMIVCDDPMIGYICENPF